MPGFCRNRRSWLFMSDFFLWNGVTVLLWGTCWGLLCLALCLGGLGRAPGQVGLAALVCALRAGTAVWPPWFCWPGLLGVRLPTGWRRLLYAVDATQEILALLLLAGIVYGWRWVTPVEAGLQRPRRGSGRPVVAVMAAVAAVTVCSAYLKRHSLPTLEWGQRLFIATLPGLVEELFYRGVLLGVLGRVFERRLWLPGTRTSWGGLVTVMLFALAHGLKSQAYVMAMMPASNHHVSLEGWYYWLPLWHSSAADQLYYLVRGSLFLWVRERTGSVWAAAGAHCLLNGCLALGASLG